MRSRPRPPISSRIPRSSGDYSTLKTSVVIMQITMLASTALDGVCRLKSSPILSHHKNNCRSPTNRLAKLAHGEIRIN